MVQTPRCSASCGIDSSLGSGWAVRSSYHCFLKAMCGRPGGLGRQWRLRGMSRPPNPQQAMRQLRRLERAGRSASVRSVLDDGRTCPYPAVTTLGQLSCPILIESTSIARRIACWTEQARLATCNAWQEEEQAHSGFRGGVTSCGPPACDPFRFGCRTPAPLALPRNAPGKPDACGTVRLMLGKPMMPPGLPRPTQAAGRNEAWRSGDGCIAGGSGKALPGSRGAV